MSYQRYNGKVSDTTTGSRETLSPKCHQHVWNDADPLKRGPEPRVDSVGNKLDVGSQIHQCLSNVQPTTGALYMHAQIWTLINSNNNMCKQTARRPNLRSGQQKKLFNITAQ